MHLDIVLSLLANVDLTSLGRSGFGLDETIDDSDSDYKSDHRLEIADCRAASCEMDDDMQNDWDAEIVSHLPVCGCPSSQDTIFGAGRALSNIAGYTELNWAMIDDRWNPFSSKDNFNLASWLVWCKVARSQINSYFAEGLGGTDIISYQSAYILQLQLEVLEQVCEYLVLMEAVIDDGRHTVTLYYLHIMDYYRYLIRQVPYRSDMAYNSIREYYLCGEWLYSEMHTAGWWWDTQQWHRSWQLSSGGCFKG